jgi:peptide/nickel transport system permease protein
MLEFGRFVATRAIMALFTLVLVSLIVFSLMEMVPADCAERYLAFKNTQGSGISVEDIDAERQRLGLDKPFFYPLGRMDCQCISRRVRG